MRNLMLMITIIIIILLSIWLIFTSIIRHYEKDNDTINTNVSTNINSFQFGTSWDVCEWGN